MKVMSKNCGYINNNTKKVPKEKKEGDRLEGIKRGKENEMDFFFFTHQACNHGAGQTETSILHYFKLHCWTELMMDNSQVIQP